MYRQLSVQLVVFFLSVVFGIIAFESHAQAVPNHSGRSCSSLFLGDLQGALSRATSDDFTARVLRKEIDGVERTVVLLGESHIKTKKSAEIGGHVVDHFDYVGFEGVKPTTTWGGKLAMTVMGPIRKLAGLGQPRAFGLTRQLERLRGDNGRTEGSTIAVAHQKNIARLLFEDDVLRRDLINQLGTTDVDDRKTSHISVQGLDIMSVEDAVNLLKTYDANELNTSALGPKRNFHLEAGHKPGWAENMNSIKWILLFGAIHSVRTFAPEWTDVAFVSAGGFLAYADIGARYMSKQGWQGHETLTRTLPIYADITGRNRTMVANIEKALTSNRDVEQMLAIVGEAHVPGMAKLLEAQGFR